MKGIAVSAAALLLVSQGNLSFAGAIPKGTAVALAEKVVVENGYTTSPPERLKSPLNPELWDSALTYSQVLKMRFNTLKPKAIGVKPGGGSNWTLVGCSIHSLTLPSVAPAIARGGARGDSRELCVRICELLAPPP